MKIEKHTVPSVTYTLIVDGEVVDMAEKDKPLSFIHGIGMMVPGFESNLEGATAGSKYEFRLSPEEGYGPYNKDAVVDLPFSTFMVDGKVNEDMLNIGQVVPMQDQNGNPLNGTILEVSKETVKMDFNHMLAGKELNFAGEILEVRQASQEEIEHGHIHGPGGHEH
ncbi:MAG: FKBP-type peptidyl-prolyl cis-trans isomerase [Cyclobacteriaceae bacterium]|nr:FKBP-type peptidyl-prolyl cis-trans isomerase [Cyclobacteriaceae bacterium]